MRRWLKKWLPNSETMHHEKNLRWLPTWLHRYPYLWALNRKAVAKGVAAGLLVAFIPIPVQLLFSAILAFLLRANLPIAVASTLITNPFTFVPLNFMIYKLGTFITQSNGVNGMPPVHELELHWESAALIWQETLQWFKSLGKSYVIGLIVVSIGASITGYCLIHIIWRISIWWQLRMRRRKRKNN